MTYLEFIGAHAYAWTFITAIFFGAALARATRPRRRWQTKGRGRAEAGGRKWTPVYVELALGVALLAAGFIAGPAADFLNPAVPVYGVAVLSLTALAVRFGRAVGMPVLFLMALAVPMFLLVFEPWIPVRDSQTLGEVRVLSAAEDGELRIEVTPEGGRSNFFSLPYGPIPADLELIELHPALFFTGMAAGARLESVGGQELAEPEGIVRSSLDFVRNRAIPGITYRSANTRSPSPNPLESYEIRVWANAEVRFVSESPSP
jgi:hypothetical protein